MSNKKLRVFEAFAGVGSQSMALRNIGVNYEVVGISEVDRYAILAYDAIHNDQIEIPRISKEEMLSEIHKRHICYNFSTGKSEIPRREEDIRRVYEAHTRNKNYGDISLVDVNELPDFDFFTYSFPCKNISLAGQQEGFEKNSGTQSSLVWECERIIKSKSPKYLMMENVKNIVGKKHIDNFNIWCKKLEEIGYKNYWQILNGCDFSVPQNRERVIMISILGDDDVEFKFPYKRKDSRLIVDILEDTVEDSFILNKSFHLIDKPISNSGIKVIGKLHGTREDRIRLISCYGICHTLDSMGGGDRQPKILIKSSDRKIQYTINGYYARKLTPKECWRLMGFSDLDFEKAKTIAKLSNSKLYERAGRGIVVPMLEDVFKILFAYYID